MGRPSLANQRTTEILDAFEKCVGRYGLEGSSLERIAEEAGMRRSILRHYVGNREDLVRALADRVVEKYETTLTVHLESQKHRTPLKRLMSYLFPDSFRSTTESLLVIESLIAAAATDDEIQEKMKRYVQHLADRSAVLLREEFPHAGRQACWNVAWGIVSICFNQESLTPLNLEPRFARAAKKSAMVLIESLATVEKG